MHPSEKQINNKKNKEMVRRACTQHQEQFTVPAEFVTPILRGLGLKIYEFQVKSIEASQRPWTEDGLLFLNVFHCSKQLTGVIYKIKDQL